MVPRDHCSSSDDLIQGGSEDEWGPLDVLAAVGAVLREEHAFVDALVAECVATSSESWTYHQLETYRAKQVVSPRPLE